MRILGYIGLLFCCIIAQQASAQVTKAPSPGPSASINKVDGKGKKTGMWLNREASRMGEEGFSEFGTYDHGDKAGPWYKVDGEGELTSIENFHNNVLDGEVKYFDKGHITCIGYYRGLNPDHAYDTVQVIDPSNGNEVTRVVSTERGTMRHGTWRYYDSETGRLTREEDYQIDELIFHKDFDLSKADSLYYERRNAKMPHIKGRGYQPPLNKQVSYTIPKGN